jgi:Na+-transporting methylmalonyl-CoA/oxaloacetate decarboxylase gamma subunit
MRDFVLGLELMAYGLGGVFFTLLLFFFIVKLMARCGKRPQAK